LIVQGDGQAASAAWRDAAGVIDAQSRAATLEELFVACTRGDSLYKRQTEPIGSNQGRTAMEANRS
jgi:hypothetical protein